MKDAALLVPLAKTEGTCSFNEILKRLLELNHIIHAEEVAAGLWIKKPPAKSRQRKKASGNSVNPPEDWNGDLFNREGDEELE